MPSAAEERLADWPLWWFAHLEAAVERGDHAAASKAQRQLQRLGVEVRYGRPRRNGRGTARKEAGDGP
jgi:hypothetical protein